MLLWARYYNPRVSQWLSVDPLALKYPSRSPYEYTFSNPVKFIDPTGMEGMLPPHVRGLFTRRTWFYKEGSFNNYMISNGQTGFVANGDYGYVLANDGNTKLQVLKIQGKVDSRGNITPLLEIGERTNCFGTALFDGDYYVPSGGRDLINFLFADGYKQVKDGSRRVGDIIAFWDGKGGFVSHMIRAIKMDEKDNVIYRSSWAGHNDVIVGTLEEINIMVIYLI